MAMLLLVSCLSTHNHLLYFAKLCVGSPPPKKNRQERTLVYLLCMIGSEFLMSDIPAVFSYLNELFRVKPQAFQTHDSRNRSNINDLYTRIE